MRVLFLDHERVARRVERAGREAFDETRWYTDLTEHDDHRRSEVLAEILLQVEEEIVDWILPGGRRLHLR